MQAIKTTYYGPTNFRGSRVKAECAAKTIFVSWDDALNSEDNHTAAAQKLVDLLGWSKYQFVGGQLKSGEFVFVNGGVK